MVNNVGVAFYCWFRAFIVIWFMLVCAGLGLVDCDFRVWNGGLILYAGRIAF